MLNAMVNAVLTLGCNKLCICISIFFKHFIMLWLVCKQHLLNLNVISLLSS